MSGISCELQAVVQRMMLDWARKYQDRIATCANSDGLLRENEWADGDSEIIWEHGRPLLRVEARTPMYIEDTLPDFFDKHDELKEAAAEFRAHQKWINEILGPRGAGGG